MFTSPLNAQSPETTDFYWIVWAEMKKIKGKHVHTITRVDCNGIEIETGACFAAEELWAEKGIKYSHPSLLKLKKPDSFTCREK